MIAFREGERAYFRGRLTRGLERDSVPISLEVDVGGRLRWLSLPWDDYWRRVVNLAEGELQALECNWRCYIRSGFSSRKRRAYCQSYYCLLDKLLGQVTREPKNRQCSEALRDCVNFENFEIRQSTGIVGGAGTSSLRNPSYLLSKLRFPDALEDVRLLPLLCVGQGEKPALFYHYRQHLIDSSSGQSLLMYLPVDGKNRRPAFDALCILERMVSESGDARVAERATKLTAGVLAPFLQAYRMEKGHGAVPMELLDIGGGSGALAAAIAGQIGKAQSEGLAHVSGVKLVDILQPDLRHFWNNNRDSGVQYVMSFLDDFRLWFDEHPLSGGSIRIALISQLFNNQSVFDIREVGLNAILKGSAKAGNMQAHLPLKCLSRKKNLQKLLISQSPINLADGRTFCQLSLSPYFQALSTLRTSMYAEEGEPKAFLPVRSFDSQCLFSVGGQAILPILLNQCCLVIVYDADLCPSHIRAHAAIEERKYIALNMTQKLKLRGNYCYVFGQRGESGLSKLEGEALW